MLRYAGRRLLAAIPLLLVVPFLIFVLIDLAPGDPAVILAGEDATPNGGGVADDAESGPERVGAVSGLGGVGAAGRSRVSLLSNQSVADLCSGGWRRRCRWSGSRWCWPW